MGIIGKKEVTGGFILEILPSGLILSITSLSGETTKINDIVVSNGRFLPKGLRGRVYSLSEPYNNGCTTNFINCEFENGQIASMKFEDLER